MKESDVMIERLQLSLRSGGEGQNRSPSPIPRFLYLEGRRLASESANEILLDPAYLARASRLDEQDLIDLRILFEQSRARLLNRKFNYIVGLGFPRPVPVEFQIPFENGVNEFFDSDGGPMSRIKGAMAILHNGYSH